MLLRSLMRTHYVYAILAYDKLVTQCSLILIDSYIAQWRIA